ncbi:MAG: Ultraviolet N-glycosylase/AP lyase [Syntrophomonadaceae bacterium]|nr:Ultraviolet N-glycosylase/AP lyase [Bacillota bacterium]MBT9146987.1 Ultraviolet N-glycosylase/AP lyase [Bacillota bacterium]
MSNDSNRLHPHVKEITEALVQKFGRPTLGNKKNPFNELLYIILSSRTPPESYQDTYRSLRRGFKTANSIAEARPEYVAATIEQGGLHNKKARAIAEIASELKKTYGRVTLSPLKEMETEEAEKFLTSLPGVSTKTARCVLMYALDRPVFPVDVHCRRVAHRLGWTPSDIYLTKRQADELQEGIPEPLRRDLHVGMVLLGGNYCLPKNPRCRECPLLRFCPTGSAA